MKPLPDWLSMMAKNGSLCARDMAKLLGVTQKAFTDGVTIGLYPEADHEIKQGFKTFVTVKSKSRWKKVTAIAAFRAQEKRNG